MAYITLNKNNFFHNLTLIEKQTGSKEAIALVLKDNAYGHGIMHIAALAAEYGITKAVVRSDAEAQKIEEFFEYILVLCEIPKSYNHKRCYTINDKESIHLFPKGTRVELKVNTGMNRNGIQMHEFEEALLLIKKHGLLLEAIFTHHACADESDGLYEIQKSNFLRIKANAPRGLRFHSCNSAALFRQKEFSEDMARVGIAAYGCLELPKSLEAYDFKAVLCLYAKKISSRQLQKGESVGYGATFKAQEACCVSNYDFGYADGFLRSASGCYVTPEGINIAGRVSMDNSSFLTNKKELLLFSDAREAAKYAGSISYEVLSSLSESLEREIL